MKLMKWLCALLCAAVMLCGCAAAAEEAEYIYVNATTFHQVRVYVEAANKAAADAKAAGKEAPMYVIQLTEPTLVVNEFDWEYNLATFYTGFELQAGARIKIVGAPGGTTVTFDWKQLEEARIKHQNSPNGHYAFAGWMIFTMPDYDDLSERKAIVFPKDPDDPDSEPAPEYLFKKAQSDATDEDKYARRQYKPSLVMKDLVFDFAGSKDFASDISFLSAMGNAIDLENVTFRNFELNDLNERSAVSADLAVLLMKDCVFEDNDMAAQYVTTELLRASSTTTVMIDSRFEDNTGTMCCAVRFSMMSPSFGKGRAYLENVTFKGNTSAGHPAIKCDFSELTLVDCTFTENMAVCEDESGREGGGAIGTTQCKATMTNCTFTKNYTDFSGGALELFNGSDVTLIGCSLTENTAGTHGGAICLADHFTNDPTQGSKLTIYGTDISDNVVDSTQAKADHRADNFSPGGGAIYMHSNCELILRRDKVTGTETTISRNKVLVPNGSTASVFNGGGIYGAYGCVLNLDGALITENTAQNGGGVYLEGAGKLVGIQGPHDPTTTEKPWGTGATMNFSDGLVANNVATQNGGGIYVGGQTKVDDKTLAGAVFTLTSGVIRENHAYDMGGGVYVQSSSDAGTAGVFKMTSGALYNNVAGKDGNTSTEASDAGADVYCEGGGAKITVTSAVDISHYIQDTNNAYVPDADRDNWYSDWYDDYSDQDAEYGKAPYKTGSEPNTGRFESSQVIDAVTYAPTADDTARNALILVPQTSLKLVKTTVNVGGKPEGDFVFDIELTNLPDSSATGGLYPVAYSSDATSASFGQHQNGTQYVDLGGGSATVAMQPGGTVEIRRLPPGTTFRIVETDRAGFEDANITSCNVVGPDIQNAQYVITGSTVTAWNGGRTRSDVYYDNMKQGAVPQTGDGTSLTGLLALFGAAAAGAFALRKKRK